MSEAVDPSALRIATFNVETLGEPQQGGLTLDERLRLLRPQILRLRADVLCLQEVDAQGSGKARDRTLTADRIMITVRITIHAQEGLFFMDGTGIEDLTVKGYGDEQSNAESMAFRRACARFGLGLDLYEG